MHMISLFAALCTFDEPAQADASNWYLTGGLYQETVDFELTFAGGNRDTLEFEDDLAFRIGVGKPISEDWNIEFEFGFGESDWDGTLIFIDGSTERARLEYEYFQAAALMCYQMNVSDTFKVHVIFSDTEEGVRIVANNNLHDKIVVEKDGNQLIILRIIL